MSRRDTPTAVLHLTRDTWLALRAEYIERYVSQSKPYGHDEWDVRRRAAKYWELRNGC